LGWGLIGTKGTKLVLLSGESRHHNALNQDFKEMIWGLIRSFWIQLVLLSGESRHHDALNQDFKGVIWA
jgi:putative heme iron utilization protein